MFKLGYCHNRNSISFIKQFRWVVYDNFIVDVCIMFVIV